jgi:hypothetical protein
MFFFSIFLIIFIYFLTIGIIYFHDKITAFPTIYVYSECLIFIVYFLLKIISNFKIFINAMKQYKEDWRNIAIN